MSEEKKGSEVRDLKVTFFFKKREKANRLSQDNNKI